MGLKTCLLFALIMVGVLMFVNAYEEKKPLVQPFYCFLSSEVGPCKGSHQRYKWDPISSRCGQFTYGGCFGNANNFMTKEECEHACAPEARHETD